MTVAEGRRGLQPLPQLVLDTYEPCTFAYSADLESGRGDELPTLNAWVEVFRASIPQFRSRAASCTDGNPADRQMRADRFASGYGEALDRILEDAGAGRADSRPPSCISLCALREECLRKESFEDAFRQVKDEENNKALLLLPDVLAELDNISDHTKRLELLIRGVFAGNVFDLGAAGSAELFRTHGAAFKETRESLVEQPWAVDDLQAVLQRFQSRQYRKAVAFVDNAGSDVVLGMLPLARELLGRGTQVVLAANSRPSINDITAPELHAVVLASGRLDSTLGRSLSEGALRVVPSGSDLPVIDLRKVQGQVSEEVLEAAGDADLIILEGMGRGIETNLHARFTVDSLKLGMIKHKEVAQMLGGRLYDCVCRFIPGDAGGEPPAAGRAPAAHEACSAQRLGSAGGDQLAAAAGPSVVFGVGKMA